MQRINSQSKDEGEFYESDEGDQLYVTGNVKLTQADKDIAAYSANYNQSNDTMQLYKDVSISLQNLDWAIDKDLKRDLSNEDIKNSLNQETTITCDKLLFDGQKKETILLGNIKIIQSDKIIYCDKLKLYDETSIVECFGNVKVIKDEKEEVEGQVLVQVKLLEEVLRVKNLDLEYQSMALKVVKCLFIDVYLKEVLKITLKTKFRILVLV